MEHSVSPYVIRCFDSQYTNETPETMHDNRPSVKYRRLDNLRGVDFLEGVLLPFLNHFGVLTRDFDNKLIYQFINIVEDLDGRTVSGYLKKGHWGAPAAIEDAQGIIPTYDMNHEQAATMNYYFQVYVPNDRVEAICLFQGIGNTGVKTVFEDMLRNWFRVIVPSMGIQFHPLQFGEIYDEWQSALTRRIRVNNFKKMAADSASVVNEVVENTQELIIKIKEDLPLWKLLSSNEHAYQMIEMFESEGSDVRAEVVLDGKKRTLRVGNYRSIQSDVIIEENDVSRENGILNHDELAAFTTQMISAITQRIYR